MVRREVVRVSCSVRLWVRSFSESARGVPLVVSVDVVLALLWGCAAGWLVRDRRIDCGIGVDICLSCTTGTETLGLKGSSSSSSEGVSSPRRSSPSEESSLASLGACFSISTSVPSYIASPKHTSFKPLNLSANASIASLFLKSST